MIIIRVHVRTSGAFTDVAGCVVVSQGCFFFNTLGSISWPNEVGYKYFT